MRNGTWSAVAVGIVAVGLTKTAELIAPKTSLMPCILVTADATEGLMRKAFHARVYSVIPKPVSRHVVLYTVVRALERAYGGSPGQATA